MDVVSDGTGERHPFEERVAAFGPDHHREWQQLIEWLEREYDREITLEAILFLVGIQSRGRGFEPELDRDIKENVIMEGTYCVMAAKIGRASCRERVEGEGGDAPRKERERD